MLLKHLPRESATVQAVHGPVVRWGPTEYLLARAVDLLAAGNWQRAGSKKNPRPKPIPRPGDRVRGAARADPDALRRRLLEQRDRVRR